MLEPTCEYEEGEIYYGSTTQPLIIKDIISTNHSVFREAKLKRKVFFI